MGEWPKTIYENRSGVRIMNPTWDDFDASEWKEVEVIPADLGWKLFMAGWEESGEGFNGEYVSPKYRDEASLRKRLRPAYEAVFTRYEQIVGPDNENPGPDTRDEDNEDARYWSHPDMK